MPNNRDKYRKNPKISDTQKICCNHPKSWTRRLFLRVMHPKDAAGIANNVDSHPMRPIVCPDLSVQKLRNISVCFISTKTLYLHFIVFVSKKEKNHLLTCGQNDTRHATCVVASNLRSPEFGCITYAEGEKVQCDYLEEILLLSSHNFQSPFEL